MEGTVTTRPAAQYLRMSTDHQRYSLASQAAAIAVYAAAHGFEVVRSYEDAGKSGVTTAGREGLKALLADVVGGQAPFSTILVLDVSRWGRYQDPDQAAHYEFVCRDAGVAVRYCAEMFGEDGTMTASILKHLKRVMAGEYSRELSVKSKSGKWRQAANGLAVGGVAPYGFRRQAMNVDNSPGPILSLGERKPRLDQCVRYVPGPPEELAQIRQIYRWYVNQHLWPLEITRRLNRAGLTWQDGSPWTSPRVRSVLRCELVGGLQIFGRNHCDLGRVGRNARDQWLVRKLFPPVISPTLVEAARRRQTALGRSRRLTDAEILNDLRSVLKRHGRLTLKLIQQECNASLAVIHRRFGTYRKAYELIGYTSCPPRRSHDAEGVPLSEEAVLNLLRRHYDRVGRIHCAAIDKDPDLPSSSFYVRRFGSLVAAYARAGIPYPMPRAKPLKRLPPPPPSFDDPVFGH